MKTVDDALAYADTFDKPANKHMSIVMLATEVRRLQAENERLRENAKIISELEQLAARSNNDLLVENERLKSLSSIPPECRTCANRGRVNGLSQESYCDSCVYQGRDCRQNHFVDASKMVDAVKRRCEACAILPCSCK